MTPMSRDVPRPSVPWPCPDCPFTGDAETLFVHLMSVHGNRRVRTVTPNPNRRADDVSPWVARNLRAAAAGEGLHRKRIA